MNRKQILYVIVVSLIAFIIWIIGEAVLMFGFPDSTMTAARIWAIAVFAAAVIWDLLHFYRAEKKRREDEENDNYKGVY